MGWGMNDREGSVAERSEQGCQRERRAVGKARSSRCKNFGIYSKLILLYAKQQLYSTSCQHLCFLLQRWPYSSPSWMSLKHSKTTILIPQISKLSDYCYYYYYFFCQDLFLLLYFLHCFFFHRSTSPYLIFSC